MSTLPYASRTYQSTAVATADPRHQVVLLFDALVRFLHRAEHHLATSDHYELCQAIVRAQQVLTALMGALDRRPAPELAQQLFALYNWLHGRLNEVGLTGDPAVLQEALAVAQRLRDAWQQAEINCLVEANHASATAPVGGAGHGAS